MPIGGIAGAGDFVRRLGVAHALAPGLRVNTQCKYDAMNYVWDPRKNRRNLARHGIAFEDAIGIFDGPTLEKVDDRFPSESSTFLRSP